MLQRKRIENLMMMQQSQNYPHFSANLKTDPLCVEMSTSQPEHSDLSNGFKKRTIRLKAAPELLNSSKQFSNGSKQD